MTTVPISSMTLLTSLRRSASMASTGTSNSEEYDVHEHEPMMLMGMATGASTCEEYDVKEAAIYDERADSLDDPAY